MLTPLIGAKQKQHMKNTTTTETERPSSQGVDHAIVESLGVTNPSLGRIVPPALRLVMKMASPIDPTLIKALRSVLTSPISMSDIETEHLGTALRDRLKARLADSVAMDELSLWPQAKELLPEWQASLDQLNELQLFGVVLAVQFDFESNVSFEGLVQAIEE